MSIEKEFGGDNPPIDALVVEPTAGSAMKLEMALEDSLFWTNDRADNLQVPNLLL